MHLGNIRVSGTGFAWKMDEMEWKKVGGGEIENVRDGSESRWVRHLFGRGITEIRKLLFKFLTYGHTRFELKVKL